MTNAIANAPIEIGPEDLAAMASAWKGPVNELSPLPQKSEQVSSTTVLLPELTNALERLAVPTAVSALAAVSNDHLIDLMIYHDHSNHNTALVNGQGKLWMCSPAPIEQVLTVLKRDLHEAKGELPHIEEIFSLHEMFIFWAMLDIVRSRKPEERQNRVAVAALRDRMDQLFAGTENLAAYFRDCLLLPLPTDLELENAGSSLAEREWVGKIGKDFLPGDPLLVIAEAFSTVPWHVLVRVAVLIGNEGLGSIQVRMMRSTDGLGFMWYETEGRITLISMDRAGLLNMVNQLLSKPAAFFVN